MIAVGHTAVGVIVGVTVPVALPEASAGIQLVAALAAGVASHYLFDLAPHGHYEVEGGQLNSRVLRNLLLDIALPVGLIGLYLLWRYGFGLETWLVVVGVLGANLPDIVNAFRIKGLLPKWNWLTAEGKFHSSTHWHNPKDRSKATAEGGKKLDLWDVWQAAVAMLAIWLLAS